MQEKAKFMVYEVRKILPKVIQESLTETCFESVETAKNLA